MNHPKHQGAQRGAEHRWPAPLVLLLTLAASPAQARAQQQADTAAAASAADDNPNALDSRGRVLLAEQRSEQAYQAYEAGDARRAIELYLQAHQLAPSADILYNVAHIYDVRLGERRLAMEFYRRCVAEPSATPERVARANQRLSELDQAELAAALALSPASPLAPPPPPSRAAPDADAGVSARSAVAWSLGALGVAGLGVGVGFGLSAMSEAKRAHADCDGNVCNSHVGVDASHAAQQDALVSTVGLVSGSVLLGGSALLFLLGDDAAKPPATGDLRWGASATHSALSVRVSGVW